MENDYIVRQHIEAERRRKLVVARDREKATAAQNLQEYLVRKEQLERMKQLQAQKRLNQQQALQMQKAKEQYQQSLTAIGDAHEAAKAFTEQKAQQQHLARRHAALQKQEQEARFSEAMEQVAEEKTKRQEVASLPKSRRLTATDIERKRSQRLIAAYRERQREDARTRQSVLEEADKEANTQNPSVERHSHASSTALFENTYHHQRHAQGAAKEAQGPREAAGEESQDRELYEVDATSVVPVNAQEAARVESQRTARRLRAEQAAAAHRDEQAQQRSRNIAAKLQQQKDDEQMLQDLEQASKADMHKKQKELNRRLSLPGHLQSGAEHARFLEQQQREVRRNRKAEDTFERIFLRRDAPSAGEREQVSRAHQTTSTPTHPNSPDTTVRQNMPSTVEVFDSPIGTARPATAPAPLRVPLQRLFGSPALPESPPSASHSPSHSSSSQLLSSVADTPIARAQVPTHPPTPVFSPSLRRNQNLSTRSPASPKKVAFALVDARTAPPHPHPQPLAFELGEEEEEDLIDRSLLHEDIEQFERELESGLSRENTERRRITQSLELSKHHAFAQVQQQRAGPAAPADAEDVMNLSGLSALSLNSSFNSLLPSSPRHSKHLSRAGVTLPAHHEHAHPLAHSVQNQAGSSPRSRSGKDAPASYSPQKHPVGEVDIDSALEEATYASVSSPLLARDYRADYPVHYESPTRTRVLSETSIAESPAAVRISRERPTATYPSPSAGEEDREEWLASLYSNSELQQELQRQKQRQARLQRELEELKFRTRLLADEQYTPAYSHPPEIAHAKPSHSLHHPSSLPPPAEDIPLAVEEAVDGLLLHTEEDFFPEEHMQRTERLAATRARHEHVAAERTWREGERRSSRASLNSSALPVRSPLSRLGRYEAETAFVDFDPQETAELAELSSLSLPSASEEGAVRGHSDFLGTPDIDRELLALEAKIQQQEEDLAHYQNFSPSANPTLHDESLFGGHGYDYGDQGGPHTRAATDSGQGEQRRRLQQYAWRGEEDSFLLAEEAAQQAADTWSFDFPPAEIIGDDRKLTETLASGGVLGVPTLKESLFEHRPDLAERLRDRMMDLQQRSEKKPSPVRPSALKSLFPASLSPSRVIKGQSPKSSPATTANAAHSPASSRSSNPKTT